MRFHGHRDMLHDTERNVLYERAITLATRQLRARHPPDQPLHAVDVGAGSGLLGCFAARAGASHRACPATRRAGQACECEGVAALSISIVNV